MTPEGLIETTTELSERLDLICEEECAVNECWQARPGFDHWIKVKCGYKDEGVVANFLNYRCSEELKRLIIAGSLR